MRHIDINFFQLLVISATNKGVIDYEHNSDSTTKLRTDAEFILYIIVL